MTPMERRYAEAKSVIPGGVNSPVRAFGGVGGTPVFFESASGATVVDADGKEYVDYIGSWGPMIVGHSHPKVVEAIRDQAGKGTSFGAPTELETEMAKRVLARIPSCAKVRFVSSGTEACMAAIRVARGYTGREAIVKFEGCYHGHADSLLVKAGSGVLTLSLPGTPGIPEKLAALTYVAPYNDAKALEELFEAKGKEIAAVILEPVVGNMGLVPPNPGYLEAVRALTKKHGIVFICDEVMTGFRVDKGGAQTRYGIDPDLSTFGKIIGGGLPVGAYGGKAEIMAKVAPEGPVYQAGTLSGNPLAMRAGMATLDLTAEPGFYEKLEATSAKVADALVTAAKEAGVPVVMNRVGSMFTPFFTDRPVTDYTTAATSNTKRFAAFFHGMLKRGVYIPPSQFEAWFVSGAHGDAEIAKTLEAARGAMHEAAAVK